MGGKLLEILLMGVIAVLAWKFLRGKPGAPQRPPARSSADSPPGDRDDAETITLERDPETGVYRPKNEQGREREK